MGGCRYYLGSSSLVGIKLSENLWEKYSFNVSFMQCNFQSLNPRHSQRFLPCSWALPWHPGSGAALKHQSRVHPDHRPLAPRCHCCWLQHPCYFCTTPGCLLDMQTCQIAFPPEWRHLSREVTGRQSPEPLYVFLSSPQLRENLLGLGWGQWGSSTLTSPKCVFSYKHESIPPLEHRLLEIQPRENMSMGSSHSPLHPTPWTEP